MQASIDAEEPVGVSAFSLVELAYAAEKKSNAIGSGQFTSILAVQALRSGGESGQAMIDRLSGGSGSAPVGWTSGTHWFDYNLDRLGLGTIDDPEWKIADRSKAAVTRAVSARAGLWGNHGYEAFYARSSPMPTVSSSTAAAATRSRSPLRRRSTPSGRSPCTTSPASTWSTIAAGPGCSARRGTTTGQSALRSASRVDAIASSWTPRPCCCIATTRSGSHGVGPTAVASSVVGPASASV